MKVDAYEFGRITIDGVRYDHDVVIEGGRMQEAARRDVVLLVRTTPELVTLMSKALPEGTNVIVHVTC